MFPNLEAELTRFKLKQSDISKLLKINSSTTSDKMNGKREWKLSECKKIATELFDGLDLDYLFATSEKKNGVEK